MKTAPLSRGGLRRLASDRTFSLLGVRRIPPLTFEQQELVEENLGFAENFALKRARGSAHLDDNLGLGRDDIRSVGRLALCEAASLWDGEREDRIKNFRWFAADYVSHRVLDHVRSFGPKGRNGDRPEVSSYDSWKDDDGEPAAHSLIGEDDPAFLRAPSEDFFEHALSLVTEREAIILDLHFREGLTQKVIGQTENISESRVSQIVARALYKIRGNWDALQTAA
jgi:RNA polymerase sigma factor (sigma-70 family)